MYRTSSVRSVPLARVSVAIPAHIADEVRRYDEHLRDVRGLAAETRRSRGRVVGQLLRQKFARREIDLGKLRPEDVRSFLARQLDLHLSHAYASKVSSALRSYLRFRAVCGDSVGLLAAVISTPIQWKLATLPRTLTSEEVEGLLCAFAGTHHPKRDYAVVRCALDMGLRAGEIARLAIGDIDWRDGTLTLKGTKSRRQDVLPLPMETGQALADYLQSERPRTAGTAIFIRHHGSQALAATSTAIQKVISRGCRRIGLPNAGAHALRHTLACRLVESGSSLKDVADVLRHRSLETTRICAKLDTPKLACVALPWPGSRS